VRGRPGVFREVAAPAGLQSEGLHNGDSNFGVRIERELCSCRGLCPVHGSRSDADEALKRSEQFAQTRDGRTREQADDDKAARQARTNAILKPRRSTQPLTGGSRLTGVSALTLEEIAAKIATAEAGLASATTQYDRNVFTQIIGEYRRYTDERAKEIAKLAAAAS
jgi:hypothetical protein